ncbi:hypothetical protein PG985_006385 [Apiospora marii]|uniref:Mid2 domain-containing protein n=1 Tax=Apiospora marii TaxID=335849 RepID=A0ABR1S7J4_9PEZI
MMCTSSGFCSTALLDSGRDQTYAHIACGTVQTTETLLAAPTASLATSTSPGTSVPAPTSPGPSPISSGTAASTTSLPFDNNPSTLDTLPQDSNSPPQTTETQSGAAGDTTPNNNTGAIIGGAIGGLAMICLTIFAIVYLFRRGRKRRSEAKTQQPPEAREFEYNTSSYAEYKTPRYPAELHSSPRAPIYAPAELHG